MSIIINGIGIPAGIRQYWGTTPLSNIVINGVEVWRYSTSRSATPENGEDEEPESR